MLAQLSSLNTAHQSLTTTSRALQVELGDLKRLFSDLQEENESYQLLLGERTLNGTLRGSELLRGSWASEDELLGHNQGLQSVGEDDEGDDEIGDEILDSTARISPTRRKTVARASGTALSVGSRGELDLASELEAAEGGEGVNVDAGAAAAAAVERKCKEKREGLNEVEGTSRCPIRSCPIRTLILLMI